MKYITGISCIAIALSAIALVRAQDLRPARFSGTIHDYSPSTGSGGPYEMGGEWTLDVAAGTANFSADMARETSDYGITGVTQVDPAYPSTRSPKLTISA